MDKKIFGLFKRWILTRANFNEILRCRMKSKQVWMKSSAHPQMKLNPSSHPAKAGFHREAISPNAVGFIPSQRTDLVEKATKFCRILSLFLGLPTRIRTADLQSRSLTRYPAVPWVDIVASVIIAHCAFVCKFFF